ncbi:MAG: hypothetical protein RR860_02980 [Janthinobacterium sp.]
MTESNAPTPVASPALAAPAPIRYPEPKTGGSYTRNLVTGALVKSAAPTTQPAKE